MKSPCKGAFHFIATLPIAIHSSLAGIELPFDYLIDVLSENFSGIGDLTFLDQESSDTDEMDLRICQDGSACQLPRIPP